MLVGNECIFKLCDFGTCKTLKDSIPSTNLGSVRYLPLERIGNVCSYGTRSDMWTVEMSLLEVNQGYLPLASKPIISFVSQIKSGWQLDLLLTLSQDTRHLLSLLFRHDVNERSRYYSDILSMPLMTTVEPKPFEGELHLVRQVLDALSTKTAE